MIDSSTKNLDLLYKEWYPSYYLVLGSGKINSGN